MAKRKTYAVGDLKAKASSFFNNNEGVTEVYATSDGYMFAHKNRANLHAQMNGLSVYTYTKTVSEPDTATETPEFLDGNVATIVNGIKSLTLTDATSFKSAEESGKNRKTVVKALADYIAKCPTAINIAAVTGAVVDGDKELVLTFTPDPGSNDQVDTSVYFESSDAEKATVDEDGVVSFLATGEVTITATAYSGYKTGTVTFTITAE